MVLIVIIIIDMLFHSGPPISTTKLESAIYFWQRGKFVPFQKLEVEYFQCYYKTTVHSRRVLFHFSCSYVFPKIEKILYFAVADHWCYGLGVL